VPPVTGPKYVQENPEKAIALIRGASAGKRDDLYFACRVPKLLL